ncbi:HAD family hydrolase [Nitriliruptor alkaliphilus]|uniref:HAD family hydrolase n=1 Tax=Nitriliruptor alkaliphilus TaxID=427918 RepID=UPI000696E4DB|nr:HAD-IA family hydrolase [Nitriliruptor alkaliphilus]
MSTRIDAVLFDLHQTLVDGGDAHRWVDLAWAHLGRHGPVALRDGVPIADLAAWLDDVWQHAAVIDSHGERDLDGDAHRQVFLDTAASAPGVDAELAAALYATLPDALTAYDDAEPVLAALRGNGVRTAVLSNIGFDVRPLLERSGLSALLDTVVLSFEVGVKKPDPAIFQLTLDRLEVPPEAALMVGDSWRDDGGAAALGVRTLVLPRTRGPIHGLDAVRRLVGT